jgi:hypothetical protein
MSRPNYFELHGRQYHSVRQLLARGWSLALIASELGGPDVIQETAFGDRKLYLKHRVDVAERESVEVVAALHEYWQAKAQQAQNRARTLALRLKLLQFRSRGKQAQDVEQVDYA